jgi:hypothetical protein
LVDYGRTQGLEWWTSEQIFQWEMRRRGVEASIDAGNVLSLRAGQPVRDATLLLLSSAAGPLPVNINSQAIPSTRWNLYGFESDAVSREIAGQAAVTIV